MKNLVDIERIMIGTVHAIETRNLRNKFNLELGLYASIFFIDQMKSNYSEFIFELFICQQMIAGRISISRRQSGI